MSGQAALDDHPTLRTLLDMLSAGGDGAIVAVGQLSVLLPEHFAREEAVGSVFDWVSGRAPELRDRVDALRAEHRLLNDLLAELDVNDRAGVDRFAKLLSTHEAEENELVAAAATRRVT